MLVQLVSGQFLILQALAHLDKGHRPVVQHWIDTTLRANARALYRSDTNRV